MTRAGGTIFAGAMILAGAVSVASATLVAASQNSPRSGMLERACGVLEEMVGLLRKGMALETTKALNDKLQAIEAEADRLILDLYRTTYTEETDPMRYLILKDMFEILEKAIDRCRDAGNVIYQIVLKNA